MAGMAEVARGAGVKAEVVEAVFNELLRILCAGDAVRVKGFGIFERKLYQGRTLRTPVIPDSQVTFPDSYRLRFRQSSVAKRRLNVRLRSKAAKAARVGKKTAKPSPAKSLVKMNKHERYKAAKAAKRKQRGKA